MILSSHYVRLPSSILPPTRYFHVCSFPWFSVREALISRPIGSLHILPFNKYRHLLIFISSSHRPQTARGVRIISFVHSTFTSYSDIKHDLYNYFFHLIAVDAALQCIRPSQKSNNAKSFFFPIARISTSICRIRSSSSRHE